MGAVLTVCGVAALAIGSWRSYAMAREALGPLAHDGDATRTAIEATRPVLARARVRRFARSVATAVGWLLIALYGLFLATAGLIVG